MNEVRRHIHFSKDNAQRNEREGAEAFRCQEKEKQFPAQEIRVRSWQRRALQKQLFELKNVPSLHKPNLKLLAAPVKGVFWTKPREKKKLFFQKLLNGAYLPPLPGLWIRLAAQATPSGGPSVGFRSLPKGSLLR